MRHRHLPPTLILLALVLAACGGNASSGGAAGPALDPSLPFQGALALGPVDAALAAEGEALFGTRCSACHKLDERYVGPALRGVTERRDPAWVMNMILAPDKMIQVDPDAQALFAEYGVPMTNQNLTEAEARALVEYLHQTAAPQTASDS
ncbi:MAG TPA: cytochrome c [Rubricoccaceae bacterium]|nr:cytochrome c [Rubricoccaceae bacterium]